MSDTLNLERLNRLVKLATLLDSQFRIPFTKWRFGLDPLLGLVPVAGDVISAGLSLIIILEARRSGVRPAILTRMIINVLIDVLVGAIPLAGDIFDAAFKANVLNVKMLRQELETRGGTVPPRKIVASTSR